MLQRVEWEPLAVAGEQGGERMVYFKYHKPLDVASSWDKNDRSSMLHFMPADLLVRKGGGEGQPIPGRIPTKSLMLQRQQQQMATYRGVPARVALRLCLRVGARGLHNWHWALRGTLCEHGLLWPC